MLKIRVTGDLDLIPVFATKGAAGADIKAASDGEIKPGEYKLVKTGIKLEIPEGYEAQVRPRSGLALKYGVTLLNSPGTIDSDYRGEIRVVLLNHSQQVQTIAPGERIAQFVITPVITPQYVEADDLSDTARGTGGFGSTGK